MIALATTAIGWVILVVSLIGWVVYYFANRNAAQARARLRGRTGAQPSRRTTTTRRWRAPDWSVSSSSACCCLVTMVIGLPLYWVLEPGRQAGAVSAKEDTFVGWGRESVRDDGQRWLQLRRLPRRHEGRRRPGADRCHRPEDR